MSEVAEGRVEQPAPARTWFGLSVRLAPYAAVRPSLAITLLRVAWRFRRRKWYRRFPWIPIPDRTYVRWRMYTAYGDSAAVPPVRDVVRYARWAVRGE